METRTAGEVTAARKRRLSHMLRHWSPLRAALRVAARFKAPRQPVGALGVIFDEAGRVLLVEHVFRTDYPWGLPGGWVEQAEDPRAALRREIHEELCVHVEVGELLASEQIGLTDGSTHPRHLGLAFLCTVTSGACRPTFEVVSFQWTDPDRISQPLAPFQRRAIELARERIQSRTRARS